MKIKKTRDDAIVPTKPDLGSGAWDLYALNDGVIMPQNTAYFDTGIAFEIPQGWCGVIYTRSGMGRKGFNRHGGFIDASFRGNLGVLLNNTTTEIKYITKGDRIAQIAFHPVLDEELELVDELSNTERGDKGWGASGK